MRQARLAQESAREALSHGTQARAPTPHPHPNARPSFRGSPDPKPIPLPQNSPCLLSSPLTPPHPPLPFFVSLRAFSWQFLRNPSSAAMAVRSDIPRTPHPMSQARLAQESAREALPARRRVESPLHIPTPTRERDLKAHQIPSPFLCPRIPLPSLPPPHSAPSPISLFRVSSCLFVAIPS